MQRAVRDKHRTIRRRFCSVNKIFECLLENHAKCRGARSGLTDQICNLARLSTSIVGSNPTSGSKQNVGVASNHTRTQSKRRHPKGNQSLLYDLLPFGGRVEAASKMIWTPENQVFCTNIPDWYNGSTSGLHPEDGGSSPSSGTKYIQS